MGDLGFASRWLFCADEEVKSPTGLAHFVVALEKLQGVVRDVIRDTEYIQAEINVNAG
jgi:hypothetical protein